jgi:DNA-binding transcriptional regulator YhcF (GntR family)
VARVYKDLERAGVLETRRGVGSFVAAPADRARSNERKARELTAFATRVLADADRHGFTVDEVLNALKALKR